MRTARCKPERQHHPRRGGDHLLPPAHRRGARGATGAETNGYTDVAAGSWYNNAVSTLSNMGIIGGYEDGTFRPNASITRAEFAKIAVSFFD